MNRGVLLLAEPEPPGTYARLRAKAFAENAHLRELSPSDDDDDDDDEEEEKEKLEPAPEAPNHESKHFPGSKHREIQEEDWSVPFETLGPADFARRAANEVKLAREMSAWGEAEYERGKQERANASRLASQQGISEALPQPDPSTPFHRQAPLRARLAAQANITKHVNSKKQKALEKSKLGRKNAAIADSHETPATTEAPPVKETPIVEESSDEECEAPAKPEAEKKDWENVVG
ncbi:hypothetical protein CkaCkLH20_06303 [Colletotrichum karsti]|uniref:Uncharacterized protein n=1 Tax=Colletotrichum karsti TaxID=1095194 RepID=A0A9P6LKR7_9PEZI|nr:uncharacterized protein CkaCkLH20_06303 [Colletotrichum karsti]KAF9876360.1 hypothetical protein CkaCkLH20_06303 [Colletotrichum karsti]